MNINNTYKGVFWIPGEHENEKNGILKFINEIAYVDLFNSFDKDPLDYKTKRRNEACCIYGVLENGKYCILHECKLSVSGGFIGITSTYINFKYIFYSTNRDLVLKNIEFQKIDFKLNTLFEWGGENSVESYLNDDNSFGLNYKKPSVPDIIFSNEKYELKLNHTTSIPFITNKKSLKIEQDSSLVLTLKMDEDIFQSFEFIQKIQDLFILFNTNKVDLDCTYKLISSLYQDSFYCYSNRKRFSSLIDFQINEQNHLFTFYNSPQFLDS